jgi:hypothetical protein
MAVGGRAGEFAAPGSGEMGCSMVKSKVDREINFVLNLSFYWSFS